MKRKKLGTLLLTTRVCKRVTLVLCQDGHRQDAVSSLFEIEQIKVCNVVPFRNQY